MCDEINKTDRGKETKERMKIVGMAEEKEFWGKDTERE